MKFVLLTACVALVCSLHAEDSIFCEVLGVESKRIQCTFFTQRVPFDRNISFHWESPDEKYDYRQHRFTLEADHGSIYDYRYYYGRTPGTWKIYVNNDSNRTLAETTFELHSEEDFFLSNQLP